MGGRGDRVLPAPRYDSRVPRSLERQSPNQLDPAITTGQCPKARDAVRPRTRAGVPGTPDREDAEVAADLLIPPSCGVVTVGSHTRHHST